MSILGSWCYRSCASVDHHRATIIEADSLPCYLHQSSYVLCVFVGLSAGLHITFSCFEKKKKRNLVYLGGCYIELGRIKCNHHL